MKESIAGSTVISVYCDYMQHMPEIGWKVASSIIRVALAWFTSLGEANPHLTPPDIDRMLPLLVGGNEVRILFNAAAPASVECFPTHLTT